MKIQRIELLCSLCRDRKTGNETHLFSNFCLTSGIDKNISPFNGSIINVFFPYAIFPSAQSF